MNIDIDSGSVLASYICGVGCLIGGRDVRTESELRSLWREG